MSQAPVSRRGNIVVITALLTPVFIGMVAIAVDLGLLSHAKQQLEVSTDNCAMAGARYLANKGYGLSSGERQVISEGAVGYARNFMIQNPIISIQVEADALETGTIQPRNDQRYYWEDFDSFDPENNSLYNAIRVDALMSDDQELPAIFGQFYGKDHYEPGAKSIAVLRNKGSAFLPFAVKDTDWASQMNPANPDYQDDWAWDEANEMVVEGQSDIVPEVVMYPRSGAGCAGNFGALNIAIDSQGDSRFVEQIGDGVNIEELEEEFAQPFSLSLGTYTWVDPNDASNIYEFGEALIELEDASDPSISGNPGLSNSSGLEGALGERIGQVVGVFLWDTCSGGGSNTQYSIVGVRFGRLMGYDLQGNPKAVWIQPTPSPPENTILGKLEIVGIGY